GAVRLITAPLAQHLDDAAGKDAVKESLAIDIRRQDLLRRGPKSAEEIIELRVLGADELLQILFQSASQRRRFAAGGDGELNGAAFDDRRHDEFAQMRHVDDV